MTAMEKDCGMVRRYVLCVVRTKSRLVLRHAIKIALCLPKLNVVVFDFFFFQAEDGIRDVAVTGVQTCALPISGLSGMPDSGHRSSATTRASCASSSARPTSRTMRARPAISLADSIFQTASMTRWVSGIDTTIHHTIFNSAVQADVCVDRKSTRLNSSHGYISYAVFCLKKK